jgi:ABC-2 type transport system permease protein
MSHRFNFLMGAVANLLWTFSQLVTLKFLFTKVGSFSQWSFGDLILLLALGQLYVYFSWMVFDPSLADLFNKINTGAFDRMLTKPLNIKFLASFEKFQVSQLFPMIVTVIPLFVYGLSHRQSFKALDLLFALIICGLGIIAFYFLNLTLSGLTFFFEEIQAIKDFIVNRTVDLSRVPLSIFPKVIQYALTFIVPIAFIAYYPVLIIQRQVSFVLVMGVEIVLIGIFYLLSKIIWSAGIKHYSGIG